MFPLIIACVDVFCVSIDVRSDSAFRSMFGRCPQMFTDCRRWSQIFAGFRRLPQMFADLRRCSQAFAEFRRCSADVRQMFADVHRYSQISQVPADFRRCSQSFADFRRSPLNLGEFRRVSPILADVHRFSRIFGHGGMRGWVMGKKRGLGKMRDPNMKKGKVSITPWSQTTGCFPCRPRAQAQGRGHDDHNGITP